MPDLEVDEEEELPLGVLALEDPPRLAELLPLEELPLGVLAIEDPPRLAELLLEELPLALPLF